MDVGRTMGLSGKGVAELDGSSTGATAVCVWKTPATKVPTREVEIVSASTGVDVTMPLPQEVNSPLVSDNSVNTFRANCIGPPVVLNS